MTTLKNVNVYIQAFDVFLKPLKSWFTWFVQDQLEVFILNR